MSKTDKLLEKLLTGNSDRSFDFDDLRMLLHHFGFNEEIKGSHHTYRIKNHEAFINIQPVKGNKAKPYQVKQVRNTLLKYFLR